MSDRRRPQKNRGGGLAPKQKSGVPLPLMPQEIAELFGSPPLLPGEDPSRYQKLLSGIISTIDPKDHIEWIWVIEITDLTWEVIRYRSLEAAYIRSKLPEQLERVLAKLLGAEAGLSNHAPAIQDKAKRLALGWRQGQKQDCKAVEDILSRNGANLETVLGQTIVEAIKTLQELRRLSMDATRRRDQMYGEIDRRRSALEAQVESLEERLVTDALPPSEAAGGDSEDDDAAV